MRKFVCFFGIVNGKILYKLFDYENVIIINWKNMMIWMERENLGMLRMKGFL